MRCSKCGADNRDGRKFCTQCGSALAAKCPRCGAAIEPAEKFCGECGAALGTPPAAMGKSHKPQIRIADTPDPENLEGERKTVTALFADIKARWATSPNPRAMGFSPYSAHPSRTKTIPRARSSPQYVLTGAI